MANKFTQFLTENQLDTRRILGASRALEKLRPEDRKLRLAKRRAKSGGKEEGKDQAQAATKPRSGRPVTPRLLDSVAAGKPITGPAKTRLLRAVNRVLEQKKKEPADLRKLF
ncbi:MAG TPA: hypothetical protein VK524_05020 [Polyangiaceae bacterium]|nr:hypothetical protein [Polyangiaceae bacterium]